MHQQKYVRIRVNRTGYADPLLLPTAKLYASLSDHLMQKRKTGDCSQAK